MTGSRTTISSTTRETPTQRANRLAEVLERVENDHERVSEALSNAVSMLRQEDVGWAMPGDGTYRGLDLKALKKWSFEIEASLTGTQEKAPNPHMRNGLMLRHSFIWSGGIHYTNVPGDKKNPGKRGAVNVQGIIDDDDNQRLVFGSSARKRRERALFSGGLYLVIGNSNDRTLRPIPLHEITDYQESDLYQDEIVAYRWTRSEAILKNGYPTGNRETKSYWIYVDWYKGKKPKAISYTGTANPATSQSGTPEPVLQNSVIFDFHANRPDGAPFGSPDAISALVWARIIRDLIMNGVKMQDALAMFAFKVTSPSKSGQQAAAMELAKPLAAGSNVAQGSNDLTPLNSAGKGYDFGSIGFVVATMAASLHISGIALSANTALAGSSYGAAKTLDLPGQMAMETRRAEHIEFDLRILKWLGANSDKKDDVTAYFDSYDDATDQYRQMQAAVLAWTTGNLTAEGFRDELEIIYGRDLNGGIPKGVIIPNNQQQVDDAAALAAQKTAALEASATAIATQTGTAPVTSTPSPTQGKGDGTGGAGHANDTKSKKPATK